MCLPDPAAFPGHTARTAGHIAGYPVSVPQFPAVVPSPRLSSVDRLPAAPNPQQAAHYRLLRRSLSALQQYQRRLSGVVAAYSTPNVSFSRKGAHAPQNSRVSAALRSNPPLSLRIGQALDFFHPAGKRASIRLSPKALSIYFSFAEYLAVQGM